LLAKHAISVRGANQSQTILFVSSLMKVCTVKSREHRSSMVKASEYEQLNANRMNTNVKFMDVHCIHAPAFILTYIKIQKIFYSSELAFPQIDVLG
jgi:flavorubredoxin